jgi:hypothetical protein
MLTTGLRAIVFGSVLECGVSRSRVARANGSGADLDDCKRQFREAWATLRAGLTTEDITQAHEMQQRA